MHFHGRGILAPLTLSQRPPCTLSFPLEGSTCFNLAFRTLAVRHTPDLRQIQALVPPMLLPLPGMFFPSEPIPSNLPQHPAAFLTYQSSAGPSSSTCHLLWEAFLDAFLSQAKSVAWSPFPGGTLFKRLLELLLRAPSPAWTWAKGCAQGVSVEWAG